MAEGAGRARLLMLTLGLTTGAPGLATRLRRVAGVLVARGYDPADAHTSALAWAVER